MSKIATSGPPLGLLSDLEYRASELVLAPGEFLLTCSDGATEARDAVGHEFGEDRLRALAGSLTGRDAEEIRRSIEEAVRGHADATPLNDDLTIVVLQRDS